MFELDNTIVRQHQDVASLNITWSCNRTRVASCFKQMSLLVRDIMDSFGGSNTFTYLVSSMCLNLSLIHTVDLGFFQNLFCIIGCPVSFHIHWLDNLVTCYAHVLCETACQP